MVALVVVGAVALVVSALVAACAAEALAVSRVLALAPDDVWALCNGSTTVKEGFERLQPSFLHYDGSAWRPVIPFTE